jgi:hypothetical protein
MDNNISNKTKESMLVRGICAAIQAMVYPTFENLSNLLEKVGYVLKKKD